MHALTIPALVRDAARRSGERTAIEDGELHISYAALEGHARRAAAALITAGIEPGDRVAIWAPNGWRWIVAALGVALARGVIVPVNTRFKGREAGYILDKTRARVLFTTSDFLGVDYLALLTAELGAPGADGRIAGLPHLERIVQLGDGASGSASFEAFLADASGASASEVQARADSVREDDVCDILFTSGTTGSPKGVMATHAQNLRAFTAWTEVVGLSAGDRYLIVNPFFHAFGYKAGWLACLLRGSMILPHAVFDVAQVLARIGRDRVTVLPGPPALYHSLLAHPELRAYDISCLRLAVTGAASIPVELIRRMKSELGFETVITGYGLTEACGIATMCRFDDDAETIAQTSGRAIPGVEVAIRDGAGALAPPGMPGEIVVRGYNVMRGYFEDAEQTREAIDAEGWLLTGDIGTLDERGYLRITDRKKDLFIVGGFNCYPAEIENLMLHNESIAQVAVVGVPDERLGEVGMAFVVSRPNLARPSPSELLAWCREHMANYKVPRHLELVDALPLNAAGKVTKHVLRERARELLARRGA